MTTRELSAEMSADRTECLRAALEEARCHARAMEAATTMIERQAKRIAWLDREVYSICGRLAERTIETQRVGADVDKKKVASFLLRAELFILRDDVERLSDEIERLRAEGQKVMCAGCCAAAGIANRAGCPVCGKDFL